MSKHVLSVLITALLILSSPLSTADTLPSTLILSGSVDNNSGNDYYLDLELGLKALNGARLMLSAGQSNSQSG